MDPLAVIKHLNVFENAARAACRLATTRRSISSNLSVAKKLSATALFLLSFIMFGSTLIEAIPLAALIGVMVVDLAAAFGSYFLPRGREGKALSRHPDIRARILL